MEEMHKVNFFGPTFAAVHLRLGIVDPASIRNTFEFDRNGGKQIDQFPEDQLLDRSS